MSIMDMNSRMAMAEKLSVQQLQQAIQSGSLPAYIGIPLIEQKTKEKAQMAAAQQGQQKPPSVVASILQQAEQQQQQEQGVDQLPSNLPIQNEEDEGNYAGGGIIAFADEGQVREPKVKLDPNNAPTVRELMEIIGGDREKFERLASGESFNPKDFTPKEMQAAQLLFSANQTKDPERYLESLNPFHDSQLDYKLRDTNFGGFVSRKEPNTAVIRRLAESESIVPHELTHTLQLRDAARGNTISRDIVPYIEKLSPETKEKIFGTAVNRFDTPREIYANLNDYAMRRNAAGEDFVNSPEGRELLPNRRMQGQYYSNTMPGIQSIYGYREDTGEKFKRNPRDSYANQVLKYLQNKKENYAGGGIVAFNDRGQVTDPARRSLSQDSIVTQLNERMGFQPFAGRTIYGRPEDVPKEVTTQDILKTIDAQNPLDYENTAAQGAKNFIELAEKDKTASKRAADAELERIIAEKNRESARVAATGISQEPTLPARPNIDSQYTVQDTEGGGITPLRSTPTATPSDGIANIPGAVSPATARQISATNPGAPATLKDAERQAANGSPQAAAAVSMVDKYIAMLEKNGDDVGRQKKEALYMALIQGGLATAGGTSPNAFANLAAGMVPAVQGYQQALAGIRKDDRARIEKLINAGMSKEKLGMELRKLGIEEKKVDALVNYYNARAGAAGAGGSSKEDRLVRQGYENNAIKYDRDAQLARRNMTTALANNDDYKRAKMILGMKTAKPEDIDKARQIIKNIESPYLEDISYNRRMASGFFKKAGMDLSSGGGGKDDIDLDQFFK